MSSQKTMQAFFAPAKKKKRTEIQPGVVRVGRRIYGSNGTLDSKLPGFTTILCLTPSSPYGSISPYCLKNKQGQLMENV